MEWRHSRESAIPWADSRAAGVPPLDARVPGDRDAGQIMELILNVLWAIVACGAFVILLPRSRGGTAAVIGIACIAALLFPIISVSDDLSARDALEESTSIRRSVAAPDLPSFALAADLPSFAARVAVTLLAIGLVGTRVVSAIVQLLPVECDPRSPPSPQV